MSNNTETTIPLRCTRPQSISYADLMKPDEDWRNLPDASERRKIQNRLAQRAYRKSDPTIALIPISSLTLHAPGRNMRDRTKEVERLKKQLQQLQEAQDTNNSDANSVSSSNATSEQDGSTSGRSTPSQHDTAFSIELSSPPAILGSEWTGSYFQAWPHTPQQDDDLRGLGLSADGERPMDFDSSSYFPVMPGTEDSISPPSAAARSRAISTSSVTSPPTSQFQQHLRSNSNPPFFSRCGSPSGSPWPQNQRSDSRDSLQIPVMSASPSPLMLDTHAKQNNLLALSPASFTLYTNPEELTLPIPDPSFSLDDLTPTAAYPTPPESHCGGSWPAFDPKSQQRDHSPSAPATNAPLLNLAVESGHIDTLKLLLQRFDILVNAKDWSGYTALQRAIIMGRTDMVSILLQHGAH